MSTHSTSSNLFSPLRDPESLIRRRNLGESSSFFDFEEVMSIPHNNPGPPPTGPPPLNNNGPPPVVRPNGPAPRSMEELSQPSIHGRGGPIALIPIQATDFRLRDTINAAAGGTFMQKTSEECYDLIENMTAHHNHWDTSATRDETSRNISSTESPECKTCGGPHSYTKCPAIGGYTQEAAYATTGNHNSGGNSYQLQGGCNMLSYRLNNYLGPPSFSPPNVQNNQNYNQSQRYYQAPNNQGRGQNFSQGNNNYQVTNYQAQVRPSNEFSNYMKINETNMRAMQTQMTNMKTELWNKFKSTIDTRINKIENQNNQIMNILTNIKMERQSPLGSRSLLSNTIANPRGDLKAITTQSGVAYDGPTIPPTPSPLLKVVECKNEATKDKPVVALKPNPKPSIPYPSRLNDQKLREKTNSQMLKFLQIFQRLHFDLIFSDALLHIPKFASDRSLL
nr:reverse transcriptase domain-containing protein [Tanacetum cinerariifolium]